MQIRCLEELGRLGLPKRILPRHHLFRLRLGLIQGEALQQLPVWHPGFGGLIGSVAFKVPYSWRVGRPERGAYDLIDGCRG